MRRCGRRLWSGVKSSLRAAGVHWGMLVVAFPMFGDLVRLIGKMCEYQDEFTAAQLKLKILDEWGERSTVVKGSEKMLASLNAIGVIQRVKQGRYVLAPRVDADEELSLFCCTRTCWRTSLGTGRIRSCRRCRSCSRSCCMRARSGWWRMRGSRLGTLGESLRCRSTNANGIRKIRRIQ